VANVRRVCHRPCPAARFSRLLRLITLENDQFARETDQIWSLWREWQRDTEDTGKELEHDRLRKTWRCGGDAHVQINKSTWVYLSTRISYTSELTCIYIPSNPLLTLYTFRHNDSSVCVHISACLYTHIRARDLTLRWQSWQEVSEFLCIKIPPLEGVEYPKKIAKIPRDCFFCRVTYVMFTKFRKLRTVFWYRTSPVFD